MNNTSENVFTALRNRTESLGPERLTTLAQTKRLIERIYGDSDFLNAVRNDINQARTMARSFGVELNPEDVSSIWDSEDSLPVESEKMGDSPLAVLWRDWTDLNHDIMLLHREAGDPSDKQPVFAKWRNRQIQRCENEIGIHAKNFSHPIFAFELSSGCSVGCSFCGFAAKKLDGVFSRTESNLALWRSVLETVVDLFGKASQTSTCYWATEPMDNPDYLALIDDFREITGELPQTTTAVPLRDIDRTREMINLYKKHQGIQNRFSILSTGTLRKVHQAFTPEELFNIKLLLYCQPKLLKTTNAGRKYSDGKHEESWDGGTIACVSGFLVNMPERTIKMISPCPASDKWPLGYMVYTKGSFADAKEFGAFVMNAINNYMPTTISDNHVLSFRDDIELEELSNGISINAKRKILLTGYPLLKDIGRMVKERRFTSKQIIKNLLDNNENYFDIIGNMQLLFDNGLLIDSCFSEQPSARVHT